MAKTGGETRRKKGREGRTKQGRGSKRTKIEKNGRQHSFMQRAYEEMKRRQRLSRPPALELHKGVQVRRQVVYSQKSFKRE